MGRGILIAELVRAQDHSIPMRTSDPSNPDPYELWVRTDLNGETDKVGELRWYDGSTTKYIWAMAVGTTPTGIEEYWRAQGPSGIMVFPVTTRSNSTHSPLSWEGPSGILGGWSPPEITVETLQATGIESDQATLEGDLTELVNSTQANVYFQWRNVGASSWNQTTFQTLTSEQPFQEQISQLQAVTEYEYKAHAEDDQYAYEDIGQIVTFTTESNVPASTKLRNNYDMRQVSASDGSLITSIPDQAGNDDLDGAADMETNGINGQKTAVHDGINDYFRVEFGSSISQPFEYFIVGRLRDLVDNPTICDGTDGGDGRLQQYNGWSIYAGGSLQSGGSADTQLHIFNARFDDNNTDSTLIIDGGSPVVGPLSGAGTDSRTGNTIGRDSEGQNEAALNWGQMMFFNDKLTTSKRNEFGNYLADNWGATWVNI